MTFRKKVFVYYFLLAQMGNCLLYSLINYPEPSYELNGCFIIAAISLVFIFTSGYLYPNAKDGKEVVAANPQSGMYILSSYVIV